MRAFRATISADRISRWSALIAVLACGTLVFCVALPLALSSPFPTPKEREWVIEGSPVQAVARAPMGREVEAAVEAEAMKEPEPFAPSPEHETALVFQPEFAADPEPIGSIPPAQPRKRVVDIMEEVDDYLWEVYRRAPVKRDSSGDFTWKDPAAARRMGFTLKSYAIGGMDRDFREQLYHAGRAMDAAGLNWSILSAFRDDYRQKLASGFKAHGGNSLHGGSTRTGGYGHGRAVDVTSAEGEPEAVWRWLDAHGGKFGLSRPMPGADPAHIQTRGDWRRIALALRNARVRIAAREAGARTAMTAGGGVGSW